MRHTPRVSVIGGGTDDPNAASMARELGRLLAQAGCMVVCGGRGGVMRAVCQGAKAEGGVTMGIVPSESLDEANEFVDIPVATDLGPMRNYLVVLNGQAAVAVEGEYGTLSEIGLARKIGRPVITLGRWSGLPGVIAAETPSDAVEHVKSLLKLPIST